MQIMGVEWTQYHWKLYHLIGGSTKSYLFTEWVDIYEFSSVQVRPSGFSSYNNVLSQVLLFSYAYSIYWFADKKQIYTPPLTWMFIISFACALTGAKVLALGIILINITLIFISKGINKLYSIRVILSTACAYFCYWMLFPGLFVYNFNLDLFSYNAMGRIQGFLEVSNFSLANNIYFFLSQYQSGDFMGVQADIYNDDRNIGSGLTSIFIYWPIIIPIFLVFLPNWFSNLSKIERTPYVDMQKLPILMLVAIASSLFGQPLYTSSYFIFFSSCILYPLSIYLIKPNRYVKSAYY